MTVSDTKKCLDYGLRHGFGIAMIEAGVPITLVRDLLGHADLKTTEIYLSAVGREKRHIVLKAWD
ncbi:MAG: tyrosine-type recombinase/integrase [Deltaproteobacteria bacterium]|nr:tyrosine-type recombinase/integrase [Deltaproteobacteria bacterium]